jgi:alkaline phosphatase
MNKIILGSSRPILGLFDLNHMQYETDRTANGNDKPNLSEMTKFAIEHFLQTNQGFFLLIEGGRIDHGHHATKARYALDEYAQFDTTIGLAKQILKEKGVLDDTLMVVTADHSHVFTMGAYSARGSNILGFSTIAHSNVSDVDNLPINIIAYGNGPNFNSPRNPNYLYSLDTNSTNYLSPAALPLKSETHGGEDVPVYAQGPWSHLFIGTMEQHTIPHKMAYAACWGAYANRKGCESAGRTAGATTTVATNVSKSGGVNPFCPFKLTKIIILLLVLIFL